MGVLYKFTLKTLLKNRMRTVVTIIGIVLSMSLLTAVIEGAYSGMQYLIRGVEEENGRYYGCFSGMNEEEADAVSEMAHVTETAQMSEVGWAKIGSSNPGKPYLLVTAVSDNIEDLIAIRITEGRMPENETEIVLPEHLRTNGGVTYQVGDTLTLEVGRRIAGGAEAHENVPCVEDVRETIEDSETKRYTVVGIMERLDYNVESFQCPGYTALTRAQEAESFDYNRVLFRLNRAGAYHRFVQEHYSEEHPIESNRDLLIFSGSIADNGLQMVFYGFVTILVLLVAFGSISLIYNSFSISVSERTRQYGILKSVGATKRQIRHTVFMEALTLSVIAIPIGLVVGCAGIGLTLYLLRDAFTTMFENAVLVKMQLVLNPAALLIAALSCLITVLISAFIPAKRAIRVSPITSIRESQDIRIRPRAVKTSLLTEKLFGFEGAMASKNFKRNRRRYRATVVSLFLSIVLFISASSFSSYLKDSAGGVGSMDTSADLIVTVGGISPEEQEKRLREIAELPGVTDCSLQYYVEIPYVYLREEDLSESFLGSPYSNLSKEDREKGIEYSLPVVFIDDLHFEALAKECRTAKEELLAGEKPQAILFNSLSGFVYLEDGRKFYSYELIDRKALPTEVAVEGDGFHGTIRIGALADHLPLSGLTFSTAILFYPISAFESVLPTEQMMLISTNIAVRTATHTETAEKIENLLKEQGLSGSVNDLAASREAIRMAILVINVFSYGFIVLISLIAVANVFNTISTNILLRRREFAMLKSVGLAESGLRKMLNYECLIYGLKGLLFGLPSAVLVTYAIYRVTRISFDVSFYIPWQSIVIAVGSVFLVVFATMIYARRKIAKDNPIDTLKLETL